MIRKAIFAAASLLASLSLAHAPAAAANLNIKDGNQAAAVLCASSMSDASLAECNTLVDTTGTKIDPATKQLQQSEISILSGMGTSSSPFTVNLGTLNGAATDATLQAIKTLLGAAPAQDATLQAIKTLLAAPTLAPNAATASAQASTLAAIQLLLQPGGKVDTIIQSTPINYSAVIGFAGTANAATSASTSLTVNTTSNFTNQAGALSGIPMVGQVVSGTGVTTGTTITAVTPVSATQYTLTLSAAATVAGSASVNSGGPQLVIPANANRRGWSQQNQLSGTTSTSFCYFNGIGTATTGPDSTILPGGPGYFDTKESHVSTGAIYDYCATPATPVAARGW